MQEMPAQQHDAQRTVLQKFVSAKKEEEATLCLLHGQSSNTIFFPGSSAPFLPPHSP